MKRTISAMVGKGSVNHNSRKFKAENVDGSRTHLNIDYCNENIKNVYHELFDEALERYNFKQTRADRKIENYYENLFTVISEAFLAFWLLSKNILTRNPDSLRSRLPLM